jgi:hypothetical protein
MKFIVLIITICVAFITNANAQSDLDKLNWMLGKWQYKTTNYNIIEGWKIKNDSTLVGYSYTIAGKDTISSEQTEIIKKNHKIIFNATVKEQNQSATIPFLMYAFSNDSIAFENTLHDFPQRIIYKKVNTEIIRASIEGLIEGRLKQRNFFYEKVK